MKIESSAFKAGDPIPVRHTGDGEDLSPPLSWSDVPDEALEMALICDDPDAPTPQPWVHWVMCRIPAVRDGLPEAIVPASASMQVNAMQGRNSWDRLGYGGPAPPKGHGVHHYHFKLYALDALLVDMKPNYDKAGLLEAMQGHVLAEAELIGTYER